MRTTVGFETWKKAVTTFFTASAAFLARSASLNTTAVIFSAQMMDLTRATFTMILEFKFLVHFWVVSVRYLSLVDIFTGCTRLTNWFPTLPSPVFIYDIAFSYWFLELG